MNLRHDYNNSDNMPTIINHSVLQRLLYRLNPNYVGSCITHDEYRRTPDNNQHRYITLVYNACTVIIPATSTPSTPNPTTYTSTSTTSTPNHTTSISTSTTSTPNPTTYTSTSTISSHAPMTITPTSTHITTTASTTPTSISTTNTPTPKFILDIIYNSAQEVDNEFHVTHSDIYVDVSGIVGAGNGLFTKTHISKNQLISQFKGGFSHESMVQYKVELDIPDHVFYGVEVGLSDRHIAYYANDALGISKTPGKYNNSDIILIKGANQQPELWLIATKAIAPNHEILTGYGNRYWHTHDIDSDGDGGGNGDDDADDIGNGDDDGDGGGNGDDGDGSGNGDDDGDGGGNGDDDGDGGGNGDDDADDSGNGDNDNDGGDRNGDNDNDGGDRNGCDDDTGDDGDGGGNGDDDGDGGGDDDADNSGNGDNDDDDGACDDGDGGGNGDDDNDGGDGNRGDDTDDDDDDVGGNGDNDGDGNGNGDDDADDDVDESGNGGDDESGNGDSHNHVNIYHTNNRVYCRPTHTPNQDTHTQPPIEHNRIFNFVYSSDDDDIGDDNDTDDDTNMSMTRGTKRTRCRSSSRSRSKRRRSRSRSMSIHTPPRPHTPSPQYTPPPSPTPCTPSPQHIPSTPPTPTMPYQFVPYVRGGKKEYYIVPIKQGDSIYVRYRKKDNTITTNSNRVYRVASTYIRMKDGTLIMYDNIDTIIINGKGPYSAENLNLMVDDEIDIFKLVEEHDKHDSTVIHNDDVEDGNLLTLPSTYELDIQDYL